MPLKLPHIGKSRLPRVIFLSLVAFNVLAVIVTCASAYAGYLDPAEAAWSAIAAMCFPAIAVGLIVLGVINLLIDRRLALIDLAGLILCIGPVLDNFPLNPCGLYERLAPQGKKTFTLLTFNSLNLTPIDGIYPDDGTNPVINYIMEQDADIVCLQEVKLLKESKKYHITRRQLDQVKIRYPYQVLPTEKNEYLAILSKYPMKLVTSSFLAPFPTTIQSAAVNIEGTDISLVSVHLASFGLTPNDKSLYREITSSRPNRKELHEVKSQLLSKIVAATRRHSLEVNAIKQYLDSVSGDAIVCGDFNDVPGSHALRSLTRYGLRAVYPEVGFGPAITYNINRFYFRIDHILYRGNLTPLWIKVGDERLSDHYSLMTRFVID